jgi:hypothetical protein
MDRPPIDPDLFDDWLRGIRYENTCPSTNSMGQTIWHSLRRNAAAWYARRYYDEHGVLPVGTHHVKCFFGRNGLQGDLKHPMPGYQESYIRTDITFPEPPPAPPAAPAAPGPAPGWLRRVAKRLFPWVEIAP